MPEFTPVQYRMIQLLSDGLPHSLDELKTCLSDDQAPKSAVKSHISNIRALLRPIGEDILVEFMRRKFHYRHVRLISSSE